MAAEPQMMEKWLAGRCSPVTALVMLGAGETEHGDRAPKSGFGRRLRCPGCPQHLPELQGQEAGPARPAQQHSSLYLSPEPWCEREGAQGSIPG